MNVEKWSVTKAVLAIILINIIAFSIMFGLDRLGIAQERSRITPVIIIKEDNIYKILTDLDYKTVIDSLENTTWIAIKFQKKTIGKIIIPDNYFNKTVSELK